MNAMSEDALTDQLHRLVRAIELGGKAVLPTSDDELLRSVVSAAARIFGAGAAAILLVDEAQDCLVFRVEVGNKEADLVGTRIPLDKGIAGYVAMTGQAIAVSNVQQDKRFNLDFAKTTGYIPKSILAAPLLLDDHVIGVLEVLDKIESSSFGMHDMELMGLFAHQAALAIRQSQQLDTIGDALERGLKKLAEGEGLPDSAPLVEALAEARRDGPETEDLLALAGLFNDLSQLGPAERRAALQILAALAEYGRSRRPRGRFS
jgi:GAF domain-containing protein